MDTKSKTLNENKHNSKAKSYKKLKNKANDANNRNIFQKDITYLQKAKLPTSEEQKRKKTQIDVVFITSK